jgi:hypothetical protein
MLLPRSPSEVVVKGIGYHENEMLGLRALIKL